MAYRAVHVVIGEALQIAGVRVRRGLALLLGSFVPVSRPLLPVRIDLIQFVGQRVAHRFIP